MRRRSLVLGALIAAAVVLVIVLARPRARGAAPAVAAAPIATAGAPAVPAPRAPRVVDPALDPVMLSADALRQSLDKFMRESIYPPSSHRWTEEGGHLMGQDWNDAIVSDLPLDDRAGHETMYRFAADRSHVGFGEPLTAWIEVWPVAEPERRLPVIIRSAVVLATGGGRRGRVGGDLAFRDDGREGDEEAGDHIYTSRFVPSEKEELTRAARVHLSVAIEAGGVERLVTRDFTYTPRPLLELVAVSSAPRDGSLGITLDLETHEPGRYLFFCEVYAADGETPVGWITHPWIELAAGRGQVELSLFGKALHDRAIAGPYVVRGFRAMRSETEDEVEAWWHDPAQHTTDAYALAAFSAFEWDGPERRDVIAALRRSIAEQDAAEQAAGGRPGAR